MNYPAISVIIPVYNSACTIKNCIDSVLNQTTPVFEIIIVNDGSTDNTEQVILEIIKHSEIVHLISQKNTGPAGARNNGIRKSKGEWIAFLDADDRWMPEKIERQLLVLNKYPDCAIIGTELFSKKKTKNSKPFEIVNLKGMLLKNRFSTSSVLVRKDILTQFFFDENKKYSEDYRLWLQIIHKNKGIVLKEGLVIYADNRGRFNRKSLSGNLWKMEKHELDNFIYLYKRKIIPVQILIPILMFSMLKFFIRLLIQCK